LLLPITRQHLSDSHMESMCGYTSGLLGGSILLFSH